MWLISTVIFFAVLFLGLRFTLFSPQVAHYSPIISLRKNYLEQFLPKLRGVDPIEIFSFTDTWMPFTFLTRQKKISSDNQVSYVHCFLGRYQSIIFPKKLLYLTDKQNHRYVFRFNLDKIEDNADVFELRMNSFNVNANLANRFGSASILVNINQGLDSAVSIKTGDIIRVCWDDSRTLVQAIDGQQTDPDQSITIHGKQIFEITRYVQD